MNLTSKEPLSSFTKAISRVTVVFTVTQNSQNNQSFYFVEQKSFLKKLKRFCFKEAGIGCSINVVDSVSKKKNLVFKSQKFNVAYIVLSEAAMVSSSFLQVFKRSTHKSLPSLPFSFSMNRKEKCRATTFGCCKHLIPMHNH